MNKTLMGASVVALSSAQVSVAQAAEWDLDWGGTINTDFVYSDQDSTDEQNGFDVLTNAEVIFTPSITLDNGLTFGARIEFEADQATNNNTDEAWIFVKGSFGEIRAGAEDSPFGEMTTGAPSYKAGVTSGTFSGTYLPGDLRFAGNANQIAGDAQRIIYYTPRFSGFQVGVSYAHGLSGDDREIENEENVFSIGANYNQNFGAASVSLSATYETCDCDDTAGTAPVPGIGIDAAGNPVIINDGDDLDALGVTAIVDAVEAGDPSAGAGDRFSLGASVGFSGVTIGGGYASYEDEVDFYNLGVGYETGPWGVALSGSYSDFDDGDEVTKVSLNGKYDLGPGVSARAFAAWGERDANDDDGFAIGTGINLSF